MVVNFLKYVKIAFNGVIFECEIALLAAVQVTGLEESEELNEYGTLSVSNENMLVVLKQPAGAVLELKI